MIEEIEGQVVATATSVEALRSAARCDDGAGDLADAVKRGGSRPLDLGISEAHAGVGKRRNGAGNSPRWRRGWG